MARSQQRIIRTFDMSSGRLISHAFPGNHWPFTGVWLALLLLSGYDHTTHLKKEKHNINFKAIHPSDFPRIQNLVNGAQKPRCKAYTSRRRQATSAHQQGDLETSKKRPRQPSGQKLEPTPLLAILTAVIRIMDAEDLSTDEGLCAKGRLLSSAKQHRRRRNKAKRSSAGATGKLLTCVYIPRSSRLERFTIFLNDRPNPCALQPHPAGVTQLLQLLHNRVLVDTSLLQPRLAPAVLLRAPFATAPCA
jgi:hypothetical protein